MSRQLHAALKGPGPRTLDVAVRTAAVPARAVAVGTGRAGVQGHAMHRPTEALDQPGAKGAEARGDGHGGIARGSHGKSNGERVPGPRTEETIWGLANAEGLQQDALTVATEASLSSTYTVAVSRPLATRYMKGDSLADDQFGTKVTLDANTIAVSIPSDDSAGVDEFG